VGGYEWVMLVGGLLMLVGGILSIVSGTHLAARFRRSGSTAPTPTQLRSQRLAGCAILVVAVIALGSLALRDIEGDVEGSWAEVAEWGLVALYIPCFVLLWLSWKVRRDHERAGREG
jgi:hypothetical protein